MGLLAEEALFERAPRAARLAALLVLAGGGCGGDPFTFDRATEAALDPVDAPGDAPARSDADEAGRGGEGGPGNVDGGLDAAIAPTDAHGLDASERLDAAPAALCCQGAMGSPPVCRSDVSCYAPGTSCTATCGGLGDGGESCSAFCPGMPLGCAACTAGAPCVYSAANAQTFPGAVAPCR